MTEQEYENLKDKQEELRLQILGLHTERIKVDKAILEYESEKITRFIDSFKNEIKSHVGEFFFDGVDCYYYIGEDTYVSDTFEEAVSISNTIRICLNVRIMCAQADDHQFFVSSALMKDYKFITAERMAEIANEHLAQFSNFKITI